MPHNLFSLPETAGLFNCISGGLKERATGGVCFPRRLSDWTYIPEFSSD